MQPPLQPRRQHTHTRLQLHKRHISCKAWQGSMQLTAQLPSAYGLLHASGHSCSLQGDKKALTMSNRSAAKSEATQALKTEGRGRERAWTAAERSAPPVGQSECSGGGIARRGAAAGMGSRSAARTPAAAQLPAPATIRETASNTDQGTVSIPPCTCTCIEQQARVIGAIRPYGTRQVCKHNLPFR